MGVVLREHSSKFMGTANKTLGRWQRPKGRVMIWFLTPVGWNLRLISSAGKNPGKRNWERSRPNKSIKQTKRVPEYADGRAPPTRGESKP